VQVKQLLDNGRLNWDLISNTFSLVGTTVLTSGLGFIYWWVAARQFSPEAVGLASAAISTMSLLGTFSMVGLGTVLIGELPRQPGKQIAFVITALLVAGSTGLIMGLIFAFAGSGLAASLQPLFGNLGSSLIFALGVSITALTLVLDQALIGLLRGDVQLWRNGLFAVVKLVALLIVSYWFSEKLGLTIYTTWLVGNLLSLLFLFGFAAYKGINFRSYRPQWGLLRGLGRTALSHHALNLALLTPNLVLPVLVTIMLSTTVNAYFYVANMVATVVFMGPAALTTVLFAVGAADVGGLSQKIRFTIKIAVLIGLVANVLLIFSADPVLGLFGPGYAQGAEWTLRILGLGIFPVIIKDHFVAIHRIQGRTNQAILPVTAGSLTELIGAILGGLMGGLTGLSLGFVIAMCLEAALMGPLVYRAVRPSKQQAKEKLLVNGELELAAQAEIRLNFPQN